MLFCVAGIDFSDNYSLVRMKPASLERKGMKSLTNSFEIGVSYFIKLMESLHKLTSSVTYKEADVINKDIWLYSERLHFHMRHTFEKIEAVSSEIKRRMEAVIYEIGEKEQEQRRSKIRSRTLEQQIRALQTELEELRKEKIEADLKYGRVKRNLRKAEKKLEEAKDKQDTYKAIGKACLFVPITGWLVSAVTLPIAFTVLQDNVDAAKYTADTEYRYKCDKEQQADSKASEIHKTVGRCQKLRENQKQTQKDIKRFKKRCEHLQQKLNQQAEISVKMRQCVNFVGGAQSRAEVLQDQMKFFYDLSSVIEPLLDLAKHLSSKQASALGLLRSNFQIEVAVGKLQMIAAADECLNALNIPAYQKGK